MVSLTASRQLYLPMPTQLAPHPIFALTLLYFSQFILATRNSGLAMSPSREVLLANSESGQGPARRVHSGNKCKEEPHEPRFFAEKKKNLPLHISDDNFAPQALKIEIPGSLQKAHSSSNFQQNGNNKFDVFLNQLEPSPAQNADLIPAVRADLKGKVVSLVSQLECPPLSEVISHNHGQIQQPFVRHAYRDHVEMHPRVKTPRQQDQPQVRQSRPHSAITDSRSRRHQEGGDNVVAKYAPKEADALLNELCNFDPNHPRRFHRRAIVSSGEAHRGETRSQKRPATSANQKLEKLLMKELVVEQGGLKF